MHDRAKVIVAGVCTLALCTGGTARAQHATPTVAVSAPVRSRNLHHSRARTLSKDDRSSVIAVALHSKKTGHARRDCSHLVHSIYERAGFPYSYVDSEDLFEGAKSFQRVAKPEAADLVVWHGHVGIVVRPAKHEFFSLLSKGPGVDDYRSRYWRARGRPRFYRYLKSDS